MDSGKSSNRIVGLSKHMGIVLEKYYFCNLLLQKLRREITICFKTEFNYVYFVSSLEVSNGNSK